VRCLIKIYVQHKRNVMTDTSNLKRHLERRSHAVSTGCVKYMRMEAQGGVHRAQLKRVYGDKLIPRRISGIVRNDHEKGVLPAIPYCHDEDSIQPNRVRQRCTRREACERWDAEAIERLRAKGYRFRASN